MNLVLLGMLVGKKVKEMYYKKYQCKDGLTQGITTIDGESKQILKQSCNNVVVAIKDMNYGKGNMFTILYL